MQEEQLEESYGTLSQTINGLISLGYNHDFNVKEDCLICHQNNTVLSPEEFQIDKVYRFEGASDPEDQSILYAISSPKYNMKGTLVNGYGISSSEASAKLIQKLETHNQHNMDIKSNDATPQRPEGNRVLDAQLVEMNLNEFIAQIKSEPTWKDSDRNSVTVYKSDCTTMVLMGLKEKAELKPHKANGLLTVQVIEGKIEFSTESKTCTIAERQMITLKDNIMHSVKAMADSFVLLTIAMNAK